MSDDSRMTDVWGNTYGVAAGPDHAPTPERRRVFAALGRLSVALGRAEAAAGVLAARLGPALAPEAPRPGPAEHPGPAAGLADALAQESERLDALADDLRRLAARVEL